MGREDDCGGTVVIRPFVAEDTEQVAVLCDQLGYPSTPQQVRKRLGRMIQDGDSVITLHLFRKGLKRPG